MGRVTTGFALLLPCVAAQTTTLLHETFDSPSGFTTTNLLGPVSFYAEGSSEYFGINKGAGASYFNCPVPVTFPTYGSSYCAAPTNWVGTDNVPTGAQTYMGFTGAYLEATRVHGGGAGWFSASPFILTWSATGTCPGTLVFSGKFASRSSGIETDDYIRVQASVDGAANATVLEFRGSPADQLAVDTDMDGIGDGTALSLTAGTFTANIPGTLTSSVVLSVALRTSSNSEDIAVDDVRLMCGPAVMSPPPPPSHATVGRHALCSRAAPARTTRTPRHARHATHATPRTHTRARASRSICCVPCVALAVRLCSFTRPSIRLLTSRQATRPDLCHSSPTGSAITLASTKAKAAATLATEVRRRQRARSWETRQNSVVQIRQMHSARMPLCLARASAVR